MRHGRNRNGFSILELLILLFIAGILIGMMLPATRRVHEASRRTQCLNNLRQIALANLNFESANMGFPSATGLSRVSTGSSQDISGFVSVLPFLEQQQRFDSIGNPSQFAGVDFPAYPPFDAKGYEPWEDSPATFLCPSLRQPDPGIAPIHYGFCIGDRARNIRSAENLRGGFAGSLRSNLAGDITDGSSNTIMLGEIGDSIRGRTSLPYAVHRPSSVLDDPSKCLKLVDAEGEFHSSVSLSPDGRGARWYDGRAGVALFNTILPPKSPSAAVNGIIDVDGIYSASGPHPGMVNVAMFDGSTHAVSADLDCGDPSQRTLTEEEIENGAPSAYGTWGALGTINDGQVVGDYWD